MAGKGALEVLKRQGLKKLSLPMMPSVAGLVPWQALEYGQVSFPSFLFLELSADWPLVASQIHLEELRRDLAIGDVWLMQRTLRMEETARNRHRPHHHLLRRMAKTDVCEQAVVFDEWTCSDGDQEAASTVSHPLTDRRRMGTKVVPPGEIASRVDFGAQSIESVAAPEELTYLVTPAEIRYLVVGGH
jgi:hypothetical protein